MYYFAGAKVAVYLFLAFIAAGLLINSMLAILRNEGSFDRQFNKEMLISAIIGAFLALFLFAYAMRSCEIALPLK